MTLRKTALIAGALAAFFSKATAADFSVAGAAELRQALAAAAPGDTIALASGHYGALDLRQRHFSPAIAINAADPRRPPIFTSIVLIGVTGVALRGASVNYGSTVAPLSSYAINIFESADLELLNLQVMSSVNGVAGDDAYGVNVRNSRRISLRGSRISDVHRGASIFDSDDVEIRGNIIRAVASDGVVARGVVNFSVIDNYFADFNIADDARTHPDAIQIWSRHATRSSENVIIRGNVIRRGTGGPSQGVFITTPEFATNGLIIEDNLIEQSMGQGIAVMNGADVIIRRNTVIPFDAATDRPGIDVRPPFSNVTVASNIMIASRLAPGVVAFGNETAGHNHPDVAGFVRDRIAGDDLRTRPADYMPTVAAGAHAFAKNVWNGGRAGASH